MMTRYQIRGASIGDASEVATLVGELLSEIESATGVQAFRPDLAETTSRLEGFFRERKYFAFLAVADSGRAVGFIALCECRALYAEGSFGIIPELYVRAEHRSKEIGQRLVARAMAFGATRGWRRLEVTTPPLPQFERTLAFYQREGFSIVGGRKLMTSL